MAKYIVSEGEDFEVEFVSRAFGASRTTALKVDGTTGLVTINGNPISSNGTVAGDLDVTGDVGGDTLTIVTDASIGDDLTVTGDITAATVTSAGVVDAATLTLAGDATLAAGADFVLDDAGAGTKIGTAATQKLALWNATPVVQPSSVGELTGFTAGVGTPVLDDSTFTGDLGTKAYTIGDIVKHLKTIGALASS